MIDAVLAKNLASQPVLLVCDCEKQMLGRDVLVLHRLSLFLSGDENLAEARAEILLPALHTWKTRDCRLHVVQNHLNVRAEFAKHWTHDSFRLFKHCEQHVLRLDFLILIALSNFDCRLNGLLAAQCEFI